ncbi:NADPH-dependent FMN reductase [Bordetella genomosp. 13]|uniref:FMN reductase (NADPH) n=1 Tax=Bordetella genomosp. 13 TaxID=463040 RepID=A0A1W6ZAY8_9BORD|nr:NADPH-dependent FMN reductase [Bordetella genomosp. 13]ARP94487.1 FMN reductase (NADPH) [Bordetella genomosp. 13]
MSILTLAGSPSSRSRSSALLRHAAQRLEQRGLSVREMGLRDIPAEELIEGHYTSHAAAALRRRVEGCGAVLISTPVYKASFAGGLKAVLDLLDEKALADKIVLPIATGGSPAHLLALEYSLKPVLSSLGARHILAGVYATDRQVTFDEHGRASIDDDVLHRLDDAVDRVHRHLYATRPAAHAVDLGPLAASGQLSV